MSNQTKNIGSSIQTAKTHSSPSSVQELERELLSCKEELQANKQRIDSLLDLLTNYVQLDFSDNIQLSDKGDEIDALAAGLKVLGEELESRLTQLNNSRNQFASLVNNLPVGVLLQDRDATILVSNPMALEMLGLTENQLLGKTSFDKDWKVLHEDGSDFPGSEHPVPRAIATLAPVKGEIMVVHRPLKNDWVWLKVNALPLLDGKGKLIHVICSFEDITAPKKAEKELLITRNQLQNLLDHSPAVTYSAKAVGDFGATFVSENIKRLTGFEASEFTNNSGFWISRVHPDDAQLVLHSIKKIYDHDKHSHEYRFKHKDGEYRWMLDQFVLIRDEDSHPKEIVGTWIDIDQRKVNDARIQKSEKLLAESQKAAHLGSWEMDVKTRKIYWSDEMYRIMGYKPQEFEVTYEKYLSCIHPGDLNQVIDEVKETEHGNESATNHKFRIVRPDGTIRYLSSFRHATKNKEGETIRIWGTSIDITEEWKAKSKSKAAFQKLIKLQSEARNFASQLNDTLEEERTRIAREIHDELGQQMVGIKMSVSSLKQYCTENEKAFQLLERILIDSDATIRSIRKITLQLRPALIDSMGLFAAVEWVVTEFGLRTGISCETKKIESPEMEYDYKISICFFRICQEALTNIAKHARASQVLVCLSQQGNRLSMIISDNGVGIAGDREKNMGMGLLGMRERAQLIGAKLSISAGVLQGTEVNLTVQV